MKDNFTPNPPEVDETTTTRMADNDWRSEAFRRKVITQMLVCLTFFPT